MIININEKEAYANCIWISCGVSHALEIALFFHPASHSWLCTFDQLSEWFTPEDRLCLQNYSIQSCWKQNSRFSLYISRHLYHLVNYPPNIYKMKQLLTQALPNFQFVWLER